MRTASLIIIVLILILTFLVLANRPESEIIPDNASTGGNPETAWYDSLRSLSRKYEMKYRYDSAYYFLDMLSEELLDQGMSGKYIANRNKANYLLALANDCDTAIILQQKLIEYSEISKTEVSYYNSLNHYYLGKILEVAGNKTNSEKEFSTAFALLEDDTALVLKANILENWGNSELNLAIYDEAMAHFNQALDIWLKDPSSYGKNIVSTYTGMAEIYDMQFINDSTLYFLRKALRYAEQYNLQYDDVTIGANHLLAICYLKTGKADSCEYLIRNNLKTVREHNLYPGYEADACIILGILSNRKGEFLDAIKYYRRDVAITDSMYGRDHLMSTASLDNIANSFMTLRMFDSAIYYAKKSVAIRLKNGPENQPKLGTSYISLGNICFYKSDYLGALNYYRQAASIYRQVYRPDHPYLGIAYGNIGSMYHNLGEYDLAIQYYKKAEELGTSKKLGMGLICIHKKEYDKGLQILTEVLDSRLNHNDPEAIASAYINLGKAYKNAGMPEKAIESHRLAIKNYTYLFGAKHLEVADCYGNIAEVMSSAGRTDSALRYYQQGLISIARGFNSTDIFRNPDITSDAIISDIILLGLLNGKAKSLYKQHLTLPGDTAFLQASCRTCRTGVETITRMSRDFKEEESSLLLFDSWRNIYDLGIKSAFELFGATHNPDFIEDAFYFAEKAKSQLLHDAIRESFALKNSGIPDSLVLKERLISAKLADAEKELQKEQIRKDEADPGKIRDLETKVFGLKQAKEDLFGFLEKSYNDFYRLRFDTKTAGLADIRKVLPENLVAMEYYLTDTLIYIFNISGNSCSLAVEQADTSFFNALNEFRELIRKPGSDPETIERYCRISAFLYSKLIAPAAIPDNTSGLLIVPDGQLGYIPVELLISEAPADMHAFENLHFLLEDYSISYANSSTLYLLAQKTKKQNAKSTALIMAPFTGGSGQIAENDKLAALREQGRESLLLPGTRQEAENIGKELSGTVFADTSATKMAFYNNAPGFRLIHLASHAEVNDDNPLLSKILFYHSPEEPDEYAELHTIDLFNMDLNAEMVVLSACNTGSGKLNKCEGIMSLARGFLQAGVNGVVMTLWSINDNSTARLMQSFYAYLKKGESRDEALRRAKLDYLHDPANRSSLHPYYWAGFVNYGSNDPIRIFSINTWLIYAGGGLLILLLLSGILIFRKYRKA